MLTRVFRSPPSRCLLASTCGCLLAASQEDGREHEGAAPSGAAGVVS